MRSHGCKEASIVRSTHRVMLLLKSNSVLLLNGEGNIYVKEDGVGEQSTETVIR